MSMDYIRRHYRVPAYRGGSVRFSIYGSESWLGKIVGSAGQYLRVRIEGRRRTTILHPTWNLQYLPEAKG